MNKMEYLSKLEACLKHRLSKAEINDIMRDYAEYFEEGRRQSKTDFEISAKLGEPELVARQIIEESAANAGFSPINMKEEWKHSKEDARQWQIGSSAKGCLSSLVKIICLLILFPFALLAVCSGAVALLLVLCGLCLMLLVPACGVLMGIAGLLTSSFAVSFSFPAIGMLGIFGSIALIALSVCVTALMVMFIRSLYRWTGRLFVSLKHSLFPNSAKKESQKDCMEQEAPAETVEATPAEPVLDTDAAPVEEEFNQPQETLLEEGNDHE